MLNSPNHSQLTEIFVEGHEYSALTAGTVENFEVARVARPISYPLGFVTCFPQLV